MYIILTPYNAHYDGNVGANLVTESTVKLIKQVRGSINAKIHFRREDFTSRLSYLNSAKAIIIPNLHITKNSRPYYYRIAKSLDDVEPPIIPINCLYNFLPMYKDHLYDQKLDKKTKSFLDYIIQFTPDNVLPSRSNYVSQIIKQNGYKARLVGDPGWYDPDYIGKPFHKPKKINQLVFTPPHSGINELFTNQAKVLLKLLNQKFKDANRIFSIHTAWDPNINPNEDLVNFASQFGWEIRYTSHDTSNLDFYKNSDLHVGYLKHGHLAHLRWRRPSIVLAENSRAQGLNETLGVAGVPAFSPKFKKATTIFVNKVQSYRPVKVIGKINSSFTSGNTILNQKNFLIKPNENAVDEVMQFIKQQKSNGWQAYDKIGRIFDDTYNKQMMPYLDESIPK